MLSPVRVIAPNIIAMYSELIYMYIASLLNLSLTPPSLTLLCVAPFVVLSVLRKERGRGGFLCCGGTVF